MRATSLDPALDLLLVRFQLETGARRSGALALRTADIDERRCTAWLDEKGGSREQTISPSLLGSLNRHVCERGGASLGLVLQRRHNSAVTAVRRSVRSFDDTPPVRERQRCGGSPVLGSGTIQERRVCMLRDVIPSNAEEHPMSTLTDLKSVLDATTDALTLHPEAGVNQVETTSDLVGACTVSSPLGEHVMTFDQDAPIGDGRGPTPGAALLAALGACQAQVYRFWSEKLGIAIGDLRVEVRGEIDVRRLFGADEAVRPGFGNVTVDVHIAGPETLERYEELRRAVDAHCPMLDVVANPVTVETAIHAAS